MIHICVPLAGPDYFAPDGTAKGLTHFKGVPALKAVLDARPWAGEMVQYHFVLRDIPHARHFAETHLIKWFPESRLVFLSHETKGALGTAIGATTGMFGEPKAPVIIDLADIYFEWPDCQLGNLFPNNIGGVIPCFESEAGIYSYCELDENQFVKRTAEKMVISKNASAGCYLFKDLPTFIMAASKALSMPEAFQYNGLYFLCPVYNALIDSKIDVKIEMVQNHVDIRPA